MKIYRYITFSLLLGGIAFLTSCEDDEAVRIPDFKDAPNVRIQIDPDHSYYDFNAIGDAYLAYNVYSENADIETIEITFQYADVVAGDTTDPQVIKTYTQADFANGIIANQRITSQELVDALGITTDDLAGGDQFLFLNRTTLADGRVYPSQTVMGYQNVPANIRLASATTSYTTVFDAVVGCPPDAPFTGTYILEQVGGPADVFNGDADIFSAGEVTIEETGPISRIFNVGYFEGAVYDFDADVPFTLLCGEIIVPPTDTGIGCGGPRFTFTTTGSNQYDPTDDSEIIIKILQNITGACGVTPNEELTLKLTKK